MKNVPRIALVYDRRKRANINSPQPVEIRLTIGSKQTFHNTGVRLLPNEWRGERVVNRADAAELNDKISILRRRIEKEINRQMEEGDILNVKNLHFQNEPTEDFIAFCEERSAMRSVKESTRAKYPAMIERLKEWGVIKTFSDLTAANVLQWDEYLHNTKALYGDKAIGRPLMQSTIYNYHKWLKLFINDAVKLGKIEANPYSRFHGIFKRGDKEIIEFLTEAELKQLINTEMSSDRYTRIKDLFLFQCYTGLPYSDMMKFDISTYDYENGKYFKNDGRTKTDKKFTLQLLSPAVEILQKYDMRLPRVSNTDYNRALKIVAAEAGIKKNIHSHMGRATFATFMLSHGTPLHIVSRMLGHTNTKQTLRYAEILATDVRGEFDKIESIFK